MLRAWEISFDYGREPILAGVSLDVGGGALHGIVGPNGAGKSTLVRCLYGALEPRSGTVWLGTRELAQLSQREIARAIGVVPQRHHPAFPVSVRHFVGLGRYARESLVGGPSRADEDVVRACLDELRLADLAERPVTELSGGEFRRVLLAQALAQEPQVLVLDEPVQQLDLLHQLEVMEFARAFSRRAGCAAAVVIHDLDLAARYCDRVTLLHRGRVAAAGAPEEVFTKSVLREAWGVEAAIHRNPATGTVQVVPIAAARRAPTDRTSDDSNAPGTP